TVSYKLEIICISTLQTLQGSQLHSTEARFCSAPWIPYNGHCFHLNRTQKTWSDAKLACRKEGGDLVSIRNVEDQSFVKSLHVYKDNTYTFWIGFSAPDPVTGYVWSDGSPVSSQFSFCDWFDGEPNNKNGMESCAELKVHRRERAGSWNDAHCEKNNNWICQIRIGKAWPCGYIILLLHLFMNVTKEFRLSFLCVFRCSEL
uniref:C-type lectin domain-containing protein n=1 Tax=Stegastes partitus TaxID=144197 RepID=A0A3B5ABR3_9TELE